MITIISTKQRESLETAIYDAFMKLPDVGIGEMG